MAEQALLVAALLGPQSVNGIDGGRATCGDYCGDGGAKSQRLISNIILKRRFPPTS